MPAVRKIEERVHRSDDFNASETYLVTLTRDDDATVCKAALHWDVDKEKALELIVNSGMVILREVLPHPGCPRPPEIN